MKAAATSEEALAILKAKLSPVEGLIFPDKIQRTGLDDDREVYHYEVTRVMDLVALGMDDLLVTPTHNPLMHMLFSHSCSNYWTQMGPNERLNSYDGHLLPEVQVITVTLHCCEYEFVAQPTRRDGLTVWTVLAVYAHDC